MRLAMLCLAAALAAACAAGCDPAQTRTWTTRASVIEVGLINSSPYMPEGQKLTPEQVEAFGAARVLVYEAWGETVKATLDGLKD